MNQRYYEPETWGEILTHIRALVNDEYTEPQNELTEAFNGHFQDAHHERRDLSLYNARYTAGCRTLHQVREALPYERWRMDFAGMADDWGFDLSSV